jgi:SNF2 family DNA or RNA helicase
MLVQIKREDDGTISIHCTYDPRIVAEIKLLPVRRWEASRKVWTMPATCTTDAFALASRLRDAGNVVELDRGIELSARLFAERSECRRSSTIEKLAESVKAVAVALDLSRIKRPLMEHQVCAVAWMVHGAINGDPHCLVNDDMGVGKTAAVIAYADELMRCGRARRCVIVCPASIKSSWADEIRTVLGDEAVIVTGSAAERSKIEAYAAQSKWVVYNYEQTWRSESFADLCNGAVLVADEAHKLKNHRSKQGSVFLKVSGAASAVVLVTGTPIINDPSDFFTLTNITHPGLLGLSRWGFYNRYADVRDNGFGREVVGYTNLDEVRDRSAGISIRRTRGSCLELPPKIRSRRDVDLDDEQQRSYVQIVEELRTSLRDTEGQDVFVRVRSAVAMLVRLQQVCDGYVANGSGQTAFFSDGGRKIAALDDLVEEACSCANGKVVVWSRFIAPIKFICCRYAALGAVAMHGSVDQSQRAAIVERFQRDPRCRIFIGQIQTAGLGLNLTAASTQVFLSRWWSPAVNLQAEDRLHRIGQRSPVNVVSLVSCSSQWMRSRLGNDLRTIDQIVESTLTRKQDVSDAVTGDAVWSLGLDGIRHVAGIC